MKDDNTFKHIVYSTPGMLIITVIAIFLSAVIEKLEFIMTLKNEYGIPLKEILILLIIIILSIFYYLTKAKDKLMKLIKNVNLSSYSHIEYDWEITKEGDFIARNTYTFRNNSKEDLQNLPTEGFVWFQNPEKEEILFRITHPKGRYKFVGTKYLVKMVDSVLQKFMLSNFVNSKFYTINWTPNLVPSLAPKEEITYLVEIITYRTEGKAFQEGTHIGFPVYLPTESIELVCKAPNGYKFALEEQEFRILDIDAQHTFPEIRKKTDPPQLCQDESKVIWKVNNPEVGKRYWIDYRFIKAI